MTEAPEDPEFTAADEPLPSAVYPDDTLEKALSRHSITLPAEQIGELDRYCQTLWDWNGKINLTRHTDYEKFVSRDVVDTLQLAKLIHEGEDVIDIGSGGGVPAIPLAIVRPDLSIVLTESIGKKARVLADLKKRLRLGVRVEPVRAEKLLATTRFDATTARGVGSLTKLLTWVKDHWISVGRLLAIKGPKWSDERGEARHLGLLQGLELRVAANYPMPGTASESVILKIWPRGALEK